MLSLARKPARCPIEPKVDTEFQCLAGVPRQEIEVQRSPQIGDISIHGQQPVLLGRTTFEKWHGVPAELEIEPRMQLLNRRSLFSQLLPAELLDRLQHRIPWLAIVGFRQ